MGGTALFEIEPGGLPYRLAQRSRSPILSDAAIGSAGTMPSWRVSSAGWGTTEWRSSLTDGRDEAACLLIHTVAIDDLGACPTVLARSTCCCE
jgi:hypothetical protein